MAPSEKLTIDTPEQVALEFPLAGIGSRFLAVFFDTLIQAIIYLVLLIGAAAILPHSAAFSVGVDKWATAALILFLFCLYWGYYAFFEAIWKGQTPGKRYTQVRVIKDNGRPITPFEAIARNLVRIIDQFPGIYAVGVITMLLNERSRRLGDYVAGTVVVHEKKMEDQPAWNLPTAVPAAAPLDVSALVLTELEVIETFLGRRLDLAPDVRQATAQKLADLFAAKLKVPPEARGPNEDFLERLAIQIRNTHRLKQV
ncbi:MAG: RDD family protein [Terriglobales bacterium]